VTAARESGLNSRRGGTFCGPMPSMQMVFGGRGCARAHADRAVDRFRVDLDGPGGRQCIWALSQLPESHRYLAPMRRLTKRETHKVGLAVLSVVGVVAIISPNLTGLVANVTRHREEAAVSAIATTSAAPVLTIKPLSVRPVISAFVTTPEQCPAPAPVAPDQPTRVCDLPKTAVYELSPEALRVDLTHVDSLRNPLTGLETVQMTMTTDSARQFGDFTAGQVGKQVAFVRGATVVWGPKITVPIDGQVLQLSGDLTAEQASEIARMLRDES